MLSDGFVAGLFNLVVSVVVVVAVVVVSVAVQEMFSTETQVAWWHKV